MVSWGSNTNKKLAELCVPQWGLFYRLHTLNELVVTKVTAYDPPTVFVANKILPGALLLFGGFPFLDQDHCMQRVDQKGLSFMVHILCGVETLAKVARLGFELHD